MPTDPATPTTPTTVDPAVLKAYQEQLDKTNEKTAALSAENNILSVAFDKIKESGGSAKNTLDFITNSYKNYTNAIQGSKAVTQEQAVQFGLLSQAVFGVGESFKSMGGGFDHSGVSAYSEQIKFLTESGKSSASVIGQLSSMAEAMGSKMPSSFKGSVQSAAEFVKGIARGADEIKLLRQSFLQLSAAGGQLGQVYDAAGPNLEKLNEIVTKQHKLIVDTAAASGVGKDQVAKYYAELGKIPGSMQSVIGVTADGVSKTSMLDASMKLAMGTGRSYGEVVGDLKSNFDTMNLSGEQSLKFVSRMSEITNKWGHLGIQFKDVSSALRGMSASFKDMTDAGDSSGRMTEGVSSILNKYIEGLKQSGMSGAHAADVVKDMTDNMSKLTVGQKAFLSSQTGGPGGLMGAFQIDKMMRDGDIAGVMDKVRQQMKKQMGSIVTMDEATQSEGAARQMQRQMLMLKNGPMGSMVKSDQDAYRMLEAMKAQDSGKSVDLNALGMQDFMKKGGELQNRSRTGLSDYRSTVEKQQMVSSEGALRSVENAFSASSAEAGPNDLRRQNRLDMQQEAKKASMDSAATAESLNRDLVSKSVAKNFGITAASYFRDGLDFAKQAPGRANQSMNTVGQIFMGGQTISDTSKDKKDLENTIKRAQVEDELKKGMLNRTGSTSGRMVGADAASAAHLKENQSHTGTVGSAAKKAEPLDIKVHTHVTGICLQCKREIDNDSNAKASSATFGQR